MGKLKLVNDSPPIHEKRPKKRDSSRTSSISVEIENKYAWILQNQPIVLCETLPHNFSGSFVKLNKVSSNTSQHRSTCLKSDVYSTDDTFRKTESQIHRSKKLAKPRVSFKDFTLHSSHKKAGERILKVHTSATPSTSKSHYSAGNSEYMKRNQSVTSSGLSFGSSSEEMLTINTFMKSTEQNGTKKKVQEIKCTQDPNRITPCFEKCCVTKMFSIEEEGKKNKVKKRDESSSSNKLSISQSSKSHSTPYCSIKSKTQLRQKTSSKRKRNKERKPKTKETEVLASRESDEDIKGKTLVLFTKRSQSENSSDSSFEKYINLNQSQSTSKSFSFRLGPSNSMNLNSPGSSKLEGKFSQAKESVTVRKDSPKFKSDSHTFMKPSEELNLVLSKRIKRQEYFPANVSNTFKSETKTSHPKSTLNKHTQNQMLEAATFPKTNGSPSSTTTSPFNKSKLLYSHGNVSYQSPLSYQEDELKSSRYSTEKIKSTDSFRQANCTPNSTETQRANYQGNDNVLMKDPIDTKMFGSNQITDFQCSEEDRLKFSTPESNRASDTRLPEIKLNEDIACSTSNDLNLSKEGPLLGYQSSFSNYQQGESLERTLQSSLIFDDYSCDGAPKIDISGVIEMLENDTNLSHVENSQLPITTILQKKNIKIMKDESISSKIIQLLPRSKILKADKESQEEPATNHSFCGQEKVAVINVQQLEQLRKDEFQSQESATYDYNMIGEELISNFSLPITQDENALLNSRILDPTDDLANLGCDGYLEDDIVNNNDKITSQNNGHIDLCNSVRTKESMHNLGAPTLSEMIKLFDPSGRPHMVPVSLENNAKFDEFMEESQCINEAATTSYILNNDEEINVGTFNCEPNTSVGSFKEPCVNTVNETEKSSNFYHRKRKWFDEKEKCSSEPVKKIRLKRRKWCHTFKEGDDFTDSSSEISSSGKSNVYDADHSVLQNTIDMFGVTQSFTNDVDDTLNNTNVNTTDLKLESSHESIVESNVNSNFETKIQTKIETVVEEKSQVDPEPLPEPEQVVSETQIRHTPSVAKRSTVNKKRRHLRRSKFTNNFSSDSSSSDDELMERRAQSSDEDLKKKDNMLKQRLQQELKHIPSKTSSILAEKDFDGLNNSVFQDEKEDDVLSVCASHSSNLSLQDAKEDDILSVCASPSLMNLDSSRCVSPVPEGKGTQSEVSYNEDSFWDTFQRQNKAECDFDLRHLIQEKSRTEKQTKNKTEIVVENKPGELFANKPSVPQNISRSPIKAPPALNTVKAIVEQKPSRGPISRTFLGVCYSVLYTGKCTKNLCTFHHMIPVHLREFLTQPEQIVYNIMRDSINMKFNYYISSFYRIALQRLNYCFALQLYVDLLNSNLLSIPLLLQTIEALLEKEGSFSKVIQNVVDRIEPNHILLLTAIGFVENHCPLYEYWETIRPFFGKILISQVSIEKILHQCMNDSKNKERMSEVFDIFTRTNCYQIANQELWVGFYNLMEVRKREAEEDMHFASDIDMTLNSTTNECIASPDGNNRSPAQTSDHTAVDPATNVDTCYTVQSIEALSPVQYCRRDDSQFWKFYDRLDSLKRGLKHKDYTYVISIIKQYINMDRSVFTRHCYRALCDEIKKSQIHVDNIIKIAVQSGELCNLREILSQLGTSVLIGLADQGLWVHAYELLKTLQNYELHNKCAGFTLLAAEICLANHRPIKALLLLKQNDIIFSNNKKWRVTSNNGDFNLRISVVTLLLESLCQEYPEKAYFVFDLILGEQPSNVSPINLIRIVDRLMLSLLAQEHMDLVMNLCKKAMRYHLNFHEITYRIVITALVPVDIDLARQFFQYATYLGVYTSIKSQPVTCMIVNVDWSEEEMYLVISEFLQKLFLNVGFAVSRIGVNQLAVSFVFESRPTRKEMLENYFDSIEISDKMKYNTKKLNKSKILLKSILQTRFDPPISLVKKEQGKICKINSKSLVKYLKDGHFNT